MIVNPNNPTGSFVSIRGVQDVVSLCRERGLALIVDEVFGLYPMAPTPRGPSVLDEWPNVLTFVIGELSKAVGPTGLKLGWVVVAGSRQSVDDALERLELICDTYLSVARPVQVGVEDLLRNGTDVTTQIAARVRRNYKSLGRVASMFLAVTLQPTEGGWYAVVQVLATISQEMPVFEVIEREHVLVHAGYFFDFPREAFLVMSLLPEPVVFEHAAHRVLAHVTGDEPSRL